MAAWRQEQPADAIAQRLDEEIFTEALARHLIPPNTTKKYVDNGALDRAVAEDLHGGGGHVAVPRSCVLLGGGDHEAILHVGEALVGQALSLLGEEIAAGLALTEYIARELGHGRKSAIVQTFRTNEPPDELRNLQEASSNRYALA